MSNHAEIRETLIKIIKKVCNDSKLYVDPEKAVYKEYSLDSIQFVQFMLMIENIFEIKLSDTLLDKIGEATINDFVNEILSTENKDEKK